MYPMSSPLVQWLMAPLNRWHLASPLHKLLALGAGAGVAYYVRTRKDWTPAKTAMAGVGAAYGASLLIHTLGQGGFGMMMMQAQPAQVPQMGVPMQQALPAAQPQGMGTVVDMKTRQPVVAQAK